MNKFKGLYAITRAGSVNIVEEVGQALAGGASIVQYRDKSQNTDARRIIATALKSCCDEYDVPLLINDDIQLAAEIGAAGVHLGQQDRSLAEARAILGNDAIIGISCYDQIELAMTAAQNGASYVAFGRFFSSRTKPDAKQAELNVLHAAKIHLNIPVVAIGGITPENAQPLIAAGADMIAVIDALFGQPDITARACIFSQLFGRSKK